MRKKISKKTRFEVFKRDRFTCQYCGRKAPNVLLEIDHIKPVAEGGKNDILNLITACFDCNRGKGKVLLSDAQSIEKQMCELEAMAERVEQLRAIQDWRDELIIALRRDCSRIFDIVQDSPHIKLTGPAIEQHTPHIMALIKRFGYETIEQSAIIAIGNGYSEYALFKKLGGIAYNISNRAKT